MEGKKEFVMELKTIRSLSADELKGEETRVAEQLFRIRFAKSLGKQEGISRIRGLKKDVARLKTIGRERALAQSKTVNPAVSKTVPQAAEPVSAGKE